VLIKLKPLSSNDAWVGRRKRSNEYNRFRRDLSLLLRPMEIPEGKLKLTLEWGFSSKGSDYDNPIKPAQDIISEYYGFNDNRIYHGEQFKKIVKKGEEYIKFKIEPFEEKTI